MPKPPSQTDGLTLNDSHDSLESKGFDAQFKPAKAGRVSCLECGTESPASAFKVHSQKRVEGVSDPDDESMVIALECPACETRGTITLAYGPRAGRDEAAVMADLPPPRRPERRR